jgi:hypothetical protein
MMTGTTGKRNIELLLTPELKLRVNYRVGKEKDFLLSQTKLRYGNNYHICIVIEDSIFEEED